MEGASLLAPIVVDKVMTMISSSYWQYQEDRQREERAEEEEALNIAEA